MADITKIVLPNGSEYNLKDTTRVPVYGMGKNLLDNGYFVNPVNQRGQTSYSGAVYGFDRWQNSGNGTVSLSGGLIINGGGLRQWVPASRIIDGETYTISLLTEYGLKTATGTLSASAAGWQFGTDSVHGWTAIGQYSSGKYDFRITGTQKNIAAKLELGIEQTLAHQENGVWVLNEIPDYEYELHRCMTSTADPSDTFANKSLATAQQLAYVETGTTASRAYSVGECFCWNGLLYRAIAPVSSGGTFTPGTNCEQVPGGGFNNMSVAGVITTGSMHDITRTGVYYLGGSVTDKPSQYGGMYVVASYSSLIVGLFIDVVYGTTYSVNYFNGTWYSHQL